MRAARVFGCQRFYVELQRVARVEFDSFMKPSTWLTLLSFLTFVSCAEEEPPVRHRVARYPSAPESEQPLNQPYNPNQPPPPPPEVSETPPPEASASPAPRTTKGDLPYGIPVPNKRCARVSSGHGSERSLHEQNFSRAIDTLIANEAQRS